MMRFRAAQLIPLFSIFSLIALLQVIPARSSTTLPQANSPTPTIQTQLENEILRAIDVAIQGQKTIIPALALFKTQVDHLKISSDHTQAVAWLTPLDPETGQVVPTEPGLAVVHLLGKEWDAVLPGESNWPGLVAKAPVELLSPEEKSIWLEQYAQAKSITTLGTYSGYHLPWTSGQTLAMTQSVGHDRYTPSLNAHYAFDFATLGTAQMFNIYSAKAGSVYLLYDGCTNGSETCSNYIVLKDTTTSPTTYQLYLHLSKGSIPSSLRTIGTQVAQGQLIGVADDTGVSTANHLHFMVHTNPSSWWGTSVDITFADVSINGGRPRITSDKAYCRNDSTYQDVCDQVSSTYVSGNYYLNDQIPPTGDILNPLTGDLIQTQTAHLEGYASDSGAGLNSAQFMANFGSRWTTIGPATSSAHFTYDWDLCSAGVPDGPVSIALRLQDKAGNYSSGLPGLKHFTKNYTCPVTTTCTPSSGQVALFSNTDYQGACTLLSTGAYTNTALGTVGNDNLTSLKIGSNVMATLYLNNNYRGRGETFTSDDSNLADNWIGSNTTTSILVRSRSTTASIAPILTWPLDASTFPANSSLTFYWDNGGNALEYQFKLTKSGSTPTTTSWLSAPSWNAGSLSPGSYTWQAKSRNSYGESTWATTRSLTIQSSSSTPSEVQAPYTNTVESNTSDWTTSTYFDLTNEKNHTSGGSLSWKYDTNGHPEDGYDTGYPNTGDLTSPPIRIPASANYYLRFWYWSQTENPGLIWDQRWVQISSDGGAYTNLFRLSDDTIGLWLQSPAISLAGYAGHAVRIRFHFETLDKYFNVYPGWYIDDIRIISQALPSCPDAQEPNNTFAQAKTISMNTTLQAYICPAGDVDYYQFHADSGDHIGILADAHLGISGENLDPYLKLLDGDGRSVLAENDDQVTAEITDSEITYLINRTGTYYLEVRSYEHPGSGDINSYYELRLVKDSGDPIASFSNPLSNTTLAGDGIDLVVNASDASSGIDHVDFYWHSGDWQNDAWVLLDQDWDSSDGWHLSLNSGQTAYGVGMAFYARVYDHAGNWIGTGAWNLNRPRSVINLPVIRK